MTHPIDEAMDACRARAAHIASLVGVKSELHCVICRSTYLVPYGPPLLERYNAEQAVRWHREHECVAS